MTILSPINPSAYANFILQQQMERYNVAQLAQKQRSIQSSYGQKINSDNREIEAWNTFKTDISDAQSFLNQTVTRTDDIRLKINEMISLAYEAGFEDISDTDTWNTLALQFDTLLKSWNSTANSNGRALNLIGEQSVSDYVFETDIYGEKAYVNHSDLTTGYYIVDSGSNTWKKESDYSSFLTQYDSTGAPTGEYAFITDGLKLDSLSGSAITFSVYADTADETQYTGTLYTSGLEVLDAWLYENLETSSGRTNAIADLEEAIGWVTHNLTRFKLARTQANYSLDQSVVSSDALQNNISDLSRLQLLALQEVDNQISSRNANSLAIINQAQVVNNQYASMFGTNSNSDFIGALLNVVS